jgi:uncharacterized coiled-coil DUF342 family protein
MEEIQSQVERLIDDIERDSQLTRDEIHSALVKLKEEIEEYQIRKEEGDLHRDFTFEDLD